MHKRLDWNYENYFLNIRPAQEINCKNQKGLEDFYNKEKLLSTFLEETSLKDFVRCIFPSGSLQKKNETSNKRGNVIVMCESNVLNKTKDRYYVKPFILFDELENLEYFENASFAYMSPVTYVGNSPRKVNMKNIHALTFDLDGVTSEHLLTLIHLIDQSFILKPTFITNSGNGLHLYYVFDEPIAASVENYNALDLVKKELTNIIWNDLTSNIPIPQSLGLLQSFRLPTSATKFGRGHLAKTYQYGDSIKLEELLTFLNEHNVLYKSRSNNKKFSLEDFGKGESKKLQKMKKEHPDWYKRRVVNKEPKKHWTVKKEVYFWWLNLIKKEVRVGARYWCIAVLAVYAKKSNTSFEQLEKDAFELIPLFNSIDNSEHNEFTEADVWTALKIYNDDENFQMSLKWIELKTGIKIERNKRNKRTQKRHLWMARNQQKRNLKKGINWRENNGRKPLEEMVIKYIRENPGKSPTQYAKELGVSRPTIYKYSKVMTKRNWK